jgi:hypothetical protein
MRSKCACIAIAILLPACKLTSQTRPEIKDEKTAVRFLVDHKANSRAADRHRVDLAFVTLSFATQVKKKNYIEFLVGMLDFDRSAIEEYASPGEQNYPAIHELNHLSETGGNVAPYLIKSIQESDGEVLRANAAETLYYSASACGALRMLKRQAEKEDVHCEQKIRLEAPTKHISDLTPLNSPCEASSPSHKTGTEKRRFPSP